MRRPEATLRQQILDAALKMFAARGYAGTSIQDIVDRTTGSKPSLYYHFESKEALYTALVNSAMDRAHELMQQAAARGNTLEQQLIELLDAQFQFVNEHRELVRVAFAAAFASPGELPEQLASCERGERNFEFVHSLIQAGMERGELDVSFDSKELTNGIYGALCFHLMIGTVREDFRLDRTVAECIVRLFLKGARKRPANTAQITTRRTAAR